MSWHIYTWAVIIGITIGFLNRVSILQSDYRQYPTYPHGYVIHLALGLIAAALGAVAVPSLLNKDYTAVTFLTLAAQQFRDVRNMERETLSRLDQMELVPRGSNYIEGIAMVFEGRNYLVIFTSFLTSMTVIMTNSWWQGGLLGVLLLSLSRWFRSGKMIQQIAEVYEAPLKIQGPNLYVDDIYLMNVGLEDNRQRIMEHGVGIIIKPKDPSGKVTISNMGQRQAILHDASTILGVYRDSGEPALVPIAKRDLNDGRLGILLLPQKKDVQLAIYIIQHVPVLESAIRKPTQIPSS
ncbi:YIEGIA family protein [Hazenella coriacea]|uniref:YIEGIA protein n=1 Tax=Hazenella coriacea TaxID=1179467 RepID=A0A4R3L5I7_9BACL|nr:YIEGIA family protein [Hazenella coriacea]TCS93414.1 hypothetical protein EDD58_10761 [Hazenella coriacea]